MHFGFVLDSPDILRFVKYRFVRYTFIFVRYRYPQ